MEVDDALPISALSHLLYCERRAALVHVLGAWSENEHTAAGQLLHKRVDEGEHTAESGIRVLRSVFVRSNALALTGVIDVVEVREIGQRLTPVETKRGARRRWARDEVQLCAQAMALEEMTGVVISVGAVFHAKSKRRRSVSFSAGLRETTRVASKRLHDIVRNREVPPPVNDERCPQCSLAAVCQPTASTTTLVTELLRALR